MIFSFGSSKDLLSSLESEGGFSLQYFFQTQIFFY